tara:strand:+ start:276 stop:542 length:267 start_codon:yes stop_codon:yes gene_type:complete
MTELEKVIERFERGYTSNLYGTVDLANFQKEYDFMELIQIAKKLTIPNVSQQRELFDAILDFTEDLPMCSEDYNRDTLYKRYIAENCG